MRSFLKGCGASAAIVVMILFSFAAGFVANAYQAGAITTTSQTELTIDSISTSPVDPPPNFEIFHEVLTLLNNEFYGDLPEGQEVPYSAVRGVLAELNDPGTVLVEPEAHQREREQFEGEFGGIGAFVGTNDAGQIEIVSPIADTPADRAGLQPHDIILEVDGEPVADMPLNEAVEMIRGPVGTEVSLLIQRPDTEETLTFDITREVIPDPTVQHRMIEGTTIGYIHLRFFSERSPEELKEAVGELQAEGANKLILDVRNNPGGVLDSAIRATSLFIEDATVVYQERRDGTREARDTKGEPVALEEPLVVVINEGSASASEVMAGALRDHGRATLVGRQSYGKGTVQIPYTLQNDSSLHVTVARWLTPDGISLGEEGLEPDVKVELPEEGEQPPEEDPFIQKAIEELEEMD